MRNWSPSFRLGNLQACDDEGMRGTGGSVGHRKEADTWNSLGGQHLFASRSSFLMGTRQRAGGTEMSVSAGKRSYLIVKLISLSFVPAPGMS